MWTQFWDMHSGGATKEEPFDKIYIEAPENEATIIFYNRFGHNPHRITCTCCGEDYSLSSESDLLQLTAFHRNCEYDKSKDKYIEEQEQRKMKTRVQCNTEANNPWGLYITLDEYKTHPRVLFIHAVEIKDDERIGDMPQSGYVWMGD